MRASPRLIRPSLRRPAPRRLGPAALVAFALAMLFAQLGQLSHHLLVSHRTCEHGELIHDHAGDVAPAEPRSKDVGVTAVREGGEHEHCDATAVRHRLEGAGPYVAEATVLTWIMTPVLAPEPPPPPIERLSLAPKSSPPRG